MVLPEPVLAAKHLPNLSLPCKRFDFLDKAEVTTCDHTCSESKMTVVDTARYVVNHPYIAFSSDAQVPRVVGMIAMAAQTCPSMRRETSAGGL